MSNENRLDDIIASKAWHELNEEEKALVLHGLGSEDAFILLKKTDLKLRTAGKSSIRPRPEIHTMLKERMQHNRQTWAGFSFAMLHYRPPVYVTTVLMMIAVYTGCVLR